MPLEGFDKILFDELKNDPLARGYAGLLATPDGIKTLCAGMMTKNRPKPQPIASADMIRWAGQDGRWVRLEDAMLDKTKSAKVRATLKQLLAILARPDMSIDITSADGATRFTELVQAGILSQAEAASVQALATTMVSRFEELGLPAFGLVECNPQLVARVWPPR